MVCGNIPVSGLTGSPLVIGDPQSATTTSSTTTGVFTSVDGNLKSDNYYRGGMSATSSTTSGSTTRTLVRLTAILGQVPRAVEAQPACLPAQKQALQPPALRQRLRAPSSDLLHAVGGVVAIYRCSRSGSISEEKVGVHVFRNLTFKAS